MFTPAQQADYQAYVLTYGTSSESHLHVYRPFVYLYNVYAAVVYFMQTGFDVIFGWICLGRAAAATLLPLRDHLRKLTVNHKQPWRTVVSAQANFSCRFRKASPYAYSCLRIETLNIYIYIISFAFI